MSLQAFGGSKGFQGLAFRDPRSNKGSKSLSYDRGLGARAYWIWGHRSGSSRGAGESLLGTLAQTLRFLSEAS